MIPPFAVDKSVALITLIALLVGVVVYCWCQVLKAIDDFPPMTLTSTERISALEAERDSLAARVELGRKSLANASVEPARLWTRLETTYKELRHEKRRAAEYVAAYKSMKWQSEQQATIGRDRDRIIQNQTNEIERLQHHVANGQECLEAKGNLVLRKDREKRVYQRQASHSEEKIQQLSEQIAAKDHELSVAAGRYTVAHQEIARLQVTMNDGTLETIQRRDQEIRELTQKFQDLNDNIEHDPEDCEKADVRLLRSRLMDSRAEVSKLQIQLQENESMSDQMHKQLHEFGNAIEVYQDDLDHARTREEQREATCASMRKALEDSESKASRLQEKLEPNEFKDALLKKTLAGSSDLEKQLQVRTQDLTQLIEEKCVHDKACYEHSAKAIVLKKHADTYERANQQLTAKFAKVTTKLQAEKQHILDALTSAQHSVRAANATIHHQDAMITSIRNELLKANDDLKQATGVERQQTDAEAQAQEQLNETQAELTKVKAELELKHGLIDEVAAHAQREIDAKQAQLDETTTQLAAAREHASLQDIADADRELKSTREQLEKVQEQFDRLHESSEAALSQINEQIKAKQTLVDATQSKLRRSNERAERAEKLASERREQHINTYKRSKGTEKLASAREQQLVAANATIAEHEESHLVLTRQLARCAADLSACDSRVKSLLALTRTQNEKLAATMTSLRTYSAHCQNAQAQVLRQQDTMNDLGTENQRLKTEREVLASKVARVSEALLSSDAEVGDLRVLAGRLRADLEGWRDEAANLQEEVEGFREVERREGFVCVEGRDGEGEGFDCEYEEEEEEEEDGDEEEEEVEVFSCPDEEEEEELAPVDDRGYDADHEILAEEEVEEKDADLWIPADEDAFEELDHEDAQWEAGNGEPESLPEWSA